MAKQEDSGTKFDGENRDDEQIKQEFLSVLLNMEQALGESKGLLQQMKESLETILDVVYQKNQVVKERYKVELALALSTELSSAELGELAMKQVDIALLKLNALNEKQRKLLKGLSTAKIIQLFLTDQKLSPQKTELSNYLAGIKSILDKNISTSESMRANIEMEKERLKSAIFNGKDNNIVISDNVHKFVEQLAKSLDEQYKALDLQKKEVYQMRQQVADDLGLEIEPSPEVHYKRPKLR